MVFCYVLLWLFYSCWFGFRLFIATDNFGGVWFGNLLVVCRLGTDFVFVCCFGICRFRCWFVRICGYFWCGWVWLQICLLAGFGFDLCVGFWLCFGLIVLCGLFGFGGSVGLGFCGLVLGGCFCSFWLWCLLWVCVCLFRLWVVVLGFLILVKF